MINDESLAFNFGSTTGYEFETNYGLELHIIGENVKECCKMIFKLLKPTEYITKTYRNMIYNNNKIEGLKVRVKCKAVTDRVNRILKELREDNDEENNS